MQLIAVFFAVFAFLAGRVYCLDIPIAGLNPVPASQFLNVSDAGIQAACNVKCQPAQDGIAACTDDACLCTLELIGNITICEQCMFEELISSNRRMPDPRAGNQVALTSYITACGTAVPSSKEAIPATAGKLAVPSNWDGPFGQGLNTGTTVVYFIATLLLGGFCITVVNSM